MSGPALYGVLAEFRTADALMAAVCSAREQGYYAEAYTPFPVEGMDEAIGYTHSRLPLIVFLGGLAGGVGSYAMQWYSAVVSYPINVGGRPLHSWPAFVPVSFALTILGAALAAVVGMLLSNGLPALRHPLFEIPEFDLATRNRFFLCLRDMPDVEAARDFLHAQGAMEVWEVAQ